jgi:hypothetical protein
MHSAMAECGGRLRRLFVVLESVAFNQKQKASKGAFERKREAVPFEFN